MARLLLGTPTQKQSSLTATQRPALSVNATLAPAALEARLREPRSSVYLEAMAQLDAGGHHHDSRAIEYLLGALRQEFPEISIEQFPIGIVSRCHLGAPYEVHTLSPTGGIIQHYKDFESLPGHLEAARALALNKSYVFVEVYPDKIRPVTVSGAVSVVKIGG